MNDELTYDEAIEFCKDISSETFPKIITLLQQGEAYRQMWEETKNKYRCFCYNKSIDVMEIAEQKYLEEAKQDEANN